MPASRALARAFPVLFERCEELLAPPFWLSWPSARRATGGVRPTRARARKGSGVYFASGLILALFGDFGYPLQLGCKRLGGCFSLDCSLGGPACAPIDARGARAFLAPLHGAAPLKEPSGHLGVVAGDAQPVGDEFDHVDSVLDRGVPGLGEVGVACPGFVGGGPGDPGGSGG